MSTGPVEWVAIVFDGAGVDPAVVPALAEIVGSGTVRILDLLIVGKDEAGVVTSAELGELDADALAAFDTLDGDVLGLLSEQDVPIVGAELPPGSTALVVLWENVWATGFAQAVRAAGGTLLTHDRVPAEREPGGAPVYKRRMKTPGGKYMWLYLARDSHWFVCTGTGSKDARKSAGLACTIGPVAPGTLPHEAPAGRWKVDPGGLDPLTMQSAVNVTAGVSLVI